ncbi:hypothetical protein FQA47_005987 [Oryzias melastigma]|uniref:Uncharacterized protein n=1 Tax=Oryzias melastigma TaxID=30732 RepID=A0A834BWI5_ORYME|nr:hypothetical protein FQA47_005987 [Oryzias melastigma]
MSFPPRSQIRPSMKEINETQQAWSRWWRCTHKHTQLPFMQVQEGLRESLRGRGGGGGEAEEQPGAKQPQFVPLRVSREESSPTSLPRHALSRCCSCHAKWLKTVQWGDVCGGRKCRDQRVTPIYFSVFGLVPSGRDSSSPGQVRLEERTGLCVLAGGAEFRSGAQIPSDP